MLLSLFLISQIRLNSLTMKKQTEYIIVVNGRPFFGVFAPSAVSVIKKEAVERFGPNAKIEVLVRTTELYEPSAVVDDSK